MRQEISIKDLFNLFYHKKKRILFFVLLFTMAGGSLYFTISPSYEVRTDVLINYSAPKKEGTVLQANEIDMNLRLIETYKQMLKSDRMISGVNAELMKPYSKEFITNNIKIETSNNSQIISIVVKEKNAESAAKLANIYAETFQKQVLELMNLKNINILKEVSAETDAILVKPSPFLFFFSSFFIGLLLCIMTVLIREFYGAKVDTVEKAERILEVPNIGVISYFKKGRKQVGGIILQNGLTREPEKYFNIVEEFRSLRTNLVYLMKQKKVKTLLVTSMSKNNGKTFISSNLAIAFARGGSKTIYIDLDLKEPEGGKLFNLPERIGITSLLSRKFTLNDVIQPTTIENLSFIGSGPLPLHSADLISSSEITMYLEQLKDMYDVIICDTSALSVSDTIILAPSFDGCLYVVDTQKSNEEKVKNSIAKLRNVGTSIIGCVLNKSTHRA